MVKKMVKRPEICVVRKMTRVKKTEMRPIQKRVKKIRMVKKTIIKAQIKFQLQQI